MRKTLEAERKMYRGAGAGAVAGPDLLRRHVSRANRVIYETAQTQQQYRGMGTTLVTTLFYDNQVAVGHIGDSRLYRLRDESLSQLTRDHSLLQEQIDNGALTREQARHSRNRGIITRAVGIDPQVEIEVHVHGTRPGDIYLLCSDGLNDMVSDDDIQLTLGVLAANLPLAAQQLVQQANDNGGRDNISVILVKVGRDNAARGGWLNRIIKWARA
jgi:protein phosphatase